jgi:hypothetical protein
MTGPNCSLLSFRLTTVLAAVGGLLIALGCAPDLGTPSTGNDAKTTEAVGGEGTTGNCPGDPTPCADWEKTVGEGEDAVTFKPGANGICKEFEGEKVEGTPVCVGAEWTCTFEGQVEEDNLCDGLDSDCDGIADVDEISLEKIESCAAGVVGGALVGVCAKAQVFCEDDEPKCDFSTLPLYVAVEGFDSENPALWCDGHDNDCDDDTDENMVSDKGYTDEVVADGESFNFDDCPNLVGVCGGGISGGEHEGALIIMCDTINEKLQCATSCGEKFVECEYDAELVLAGYETEETLCDNKDNDCNGATDEMEDVAASGCPYQGVCEGKVEAICKDIGDSDEPEPGWVCIFDPSLHLDPNFIYEDLASCEGEPGCGAETICDGMDNDCDGMVDEGLIWPQECFTQDADGTVYYHCDDETMPQCALHYPSCADAEIVEFEDCPVQEKKDVDGVNASVPVLADDGGPLLPGVCDPNDEGEGLVRFSCEPLSVDTDEEPETNAWKCNYDEVKEYNATEGTDDAEWCDGMDNNCDTLEDGELKANGTPIYIKTQKVSPHVPCRSLGACDGEWEATCNKGGENPGKWYCEYEGADIEMVDPNNPECDSGYANCIWAETKCDGLDNDCDGLADELLDGFGVDLDAACADVIDVGVCNLESLNTVCGDLGEGKGFACDFSAIEFYAPTEETELGGKWHADLCDGRDNDCDGLVDESISFPNPSLHEQYGTGCGFKGVCAAGTKAICSPDDPPVAGEAVWECDYTDLKASYHEGQVSIDGESVEVYCDGLDNDCDGLIDEGLSEDLIQALEKNPRILSGCPQKGICAGVMKWNCDIVDGDSSWVCDATDVGLSYEVVETRCDGIDNDCDGAADEDLADPGENGAECKTLGVCAEGGVTADCIDQAGEATWACYYDGVLSYDGLVESTCDGKDNDCDGFIDEDLDWEVSEACTKQGVCNSPLLSASCDGEDGWYCLYDLIEEYEAEETLCDQMDNDCDGSIDELSCENCEPCLDPTYCIFGLCGQVPGGAESYCSFAQGYCVYINPYSNVCDYADTGEAACADEKTAVLCGAGTWFDKATCSGATPVCWEGDCQVCVPGSMSCDGNTVKSCNFAGSGWAIEKICGVGTVCIGDGACVVNVEFKVSTVNLSPQQSISVDPKVASSVGGGFAVVYTARSFSGGSQTDVLWRRYTSQIDPVGVTEELVNEVVSGDQNSADIDNFPREDGGYVVVWQDTDGPGDETSGWDIVAQILPEAGPAALADTDTRILVNTSIVGNQTSPSVVCMADGTFMIAWEQEGNGDEEPEIYAQRFSPDGSKFGDEFQVNTFVPNDQRYPALARLANTGVIATWASNGQENSWDIFSQRFNKGFVKDGAEQLSNKFTNSLQSYPAVAGFGGVKAGAYVSTWESFGKDAGSLGIVINLFDKTGKAVYNDDVLVNKLAQIGPQRDPAVAVLDDNHFVVAWETQALGDDDDQEGIGAKVFDANGLELTANEFLVNEEIDGKQVNADIAAIPGNGYVVVWFSNPGGDNYSIQGRVFKVE